MALGRGNRPLRQGPSRRGAAPARVGPDNARADGGGVEVAPRPATDAYIGRYAVRDMTSAGSSLKFCLVATGEADLYPRLGRTMEWDTAAGDAVLRGAGGQVVRFDDHAR
jgi:3'(2'), 5'-bisphosphate nucleotidase